MVKSKLLGNFAPFPLCLFPYALSYVFSNNLSFGRSEGAGAPADGMFQQVSAELGREIWETGGLPGFSAAQGWFSPM